MEEQELEALIGRLYDAEDKATEPDAKAALNAVAESLKNWQRSQMGTERRLWLVAGEGRWHYNSMAVNPVERVAFHEAGRIIMDAVHEVEERRGRACSIA